MRLRGLYAITPDWRDTTRLLEAVEAALEGGADLLQFRRKHLGEPQLREEAHAMAEMCRRHGVPFIVNDDPRLALECGAEGVHLGRDDGDITTARELLGVGRLIGVSCYGDLQLATAAERSGADYVAMGSLFPSKSKPAATPIGLDTLAEARQATRIPLVGIGGIDCENASAVRLAGADMIAVIGALFEAGSVRDTARFLSSMWD